MLYLKVRERAAGAWAWGTCPSPRTFLQNKNVVAFVVENKEDITVAEKMQ